MGYVIVALIAYIVGVVARNLSEEDSEALAVLAGLAAFGLISGYVGHFVLAG